MVVFFPKEDESPHRIEVSNQSSVSSYQYNGLGDRLSQTVDGIATDYTVDLNTGLTQVLYDGTNTYIYGLGRISQQNGSTPEYFFGDALGSVRQMTDQAGAITFAQTYDPYGVVTQSSGLSRTDYGFTGESYSPSTQLTYLRARYYSPADGRFTSRDTWGGDANRPLSLNRWGYVEGNPVNLTDPSGYFSEELINASLHGQSLVNTFGKTKHGVARWGLYNLLKNASSFNKFSLRVADFSYEGIDYPLAPDPEGEWAVYESGCELIFVNNVWGFQTLPEFLNTLSLKAELNANVSNTWRPSTLQYHWYKTNGRYYSDFYQTTEMPDLIMISGGLFAGGKGSLGYVRDMYGNQYYTIGAGGVLGAGLAEHWEGYASINRAGNFPREWRVLQEGELKNIITGGSWTFGASWVSSGIGITFNRAGTIAMFGDINALYGIFGNGSYTLEGSTKDYRHAWDWIYDMPAYGPPQ